MLCSSSGKLFLGAVCSILPGCVRSVIGGPELGSGVLKVVGLVPKEVSTKIKKLVPTGDRIIRELLKKDPKPFLYLQAIPSP